ncbi:MAG: anti-sigma factor [Bacteroidales bacterium]
MKMLKRIKCLSEAQIQAYIDNEVSNEAHSKYSAHIQNCAHCRKKVEIQKHKIETVMHAINILDDYSAISKSYEKPKQFTHNFSRYVIGGSIAASILVTILLYSRNTISTSDDDCKWVALNNKKFQPNFESPNRLFRMRAVECIEFSKDSIQSVTYLVKTCKQ